ncbi:MAG: hypothetical protein P1U50_11765 [Parvibaculaceae bacterium]|nr:hypothetical protein [Parvibaculaceae bacterium]
MRTVAIITPRPRHIITPRPRHIITPLHPRHYRACPGNPSLLTGGCNPHRANMRYPPEALSFSVAFFFVPLVS